MPEEKSRQDLPEDVQEKLPPHAQEIYMRAHNSALEQYRDPGKRRGNASLEEVAHKVAWAAVEAEYEKNEQGEWVPRDKAKGG